MRILRHRSGRALLALVAVTALVGGACGTTADVVEPDDGPTAPVTHEITVYFTNTEMGEIGEVFPVLRRTADDDLPTATVEALLAGPTADEVIEGYSSWFSDETAGLLRSVRVDDGIAHVDFAASLRDVIPGASSSAGSLALLAELDTTLLGLPDVTSTLYSLDGDVAAFYEWLQMDAPG